MRLVLSLVLTCYVVVFAAAEVAQEKRSDATIPDTRVTTTTSLTEARLALHEGELQLTKLKLEMAKEGHQAVHKLLHAWEKVAERDWSGFDKHEKAEFSLHLEHALQFVAQIHAGKVRDEVFPVVIAAFRREEITKPTTLQEKVLTLSSKEKHEAKRIALTIRECLRYSAEDLASNSKSLSDINHELQKVKAARERLLPKPKQEKR